MKVEKKKLMFLPVALILGSGLFVFGHSLRPTSAQTDHPRVEIVGTHATVTRPYNMVTESRALIVTEGADQDMSPADAADIRTGTVVSLNGQFFVLRDDDNDTWYHLDDQKQAASFLGKKVRVTGAIDPATDVIHVQKIEEVKA